MCGIWFLSSLPAKEIEPYALPFPYADKWQHVVAFAVGGALLTVALLVSKNWPTLRVALVSVLAITVYGVIDEWHQTRTPTRSGGDVADIVADGLGSVIGTFLAIRFLPHERRRR